MFENLSESFQGVLKKLRGHGRITEGNVEGALNEVRLALLEADVNYKVVKDFVAAVKEKALGAEVLASLSPDQHFIKIVHDEMTRMMGAQAQELNLARKPPVPVMLVGLQGSGKTTTCGKLALYLQKKKRTPFATERLSSIVNRAFSKGLVVKMMGQALEFAPPLIIQKSEVEEGIKILDECITEEEKAMSLKS